MLNRHNKDNNQNYMYLGIIVSLQSSRILVKRPHKIIHLLYGILRIVNWIRIQQEALPLRTSKSTLSFKIFNNNYHHHLKDNNSHKTSCNLSRTFKACMHHLQSKRISRGASKKRPWLTYSLVMSMKCS